MAKRLSPSVRIEPATLDFLRDLAAHNDRTWFEAHRTRYQRAHANMQAFAEALIDRLRQHDRIATTSGRESLMRIHTDQRFHKDRPPYQTRFGGRIARVKPALRGGYFFRIEPGSSHLTCGFMGPVPDDLARIRTDILHDHPMWKRLLQAKAVRTHFGALQGEHLRTAPRGFPKDHPGIDLLRLKQFLLRHPLSDEAVLAPDLLDHADAVYRSVRPFFDHMSEVLTTDADGRSLLREG